MRSNNLLKDIKRQKIYFGRNGFIMLVKISHAADAVTNIVTKETSIYRVEIRNAKGDIKFFKLRACTRTEARAEALGIASALAKVEKQAVLWRMTNDRDWNVASELQQQEKKSNFMVKMRKAVTEFFYLPEEAAEGGK